MVSPELAASIHLGYAGHDESASDLAVLQLTHRSIMLLQIVSPPFAQGKMWSARSCASPLHPENTRPQPGQTYPSLASS